MRLLRLLWVFLRVGVMGETAYPANFVAHLVDAALELGTALAGLALVFAHTTTLAGWRADELIALVGGVIGLVIQPGMEQLTEAVLDGTLDFTLAKPEDAQLLVSVWRVEIWKMIDIGLGLAVLGIGLARMGQRVGLVDAVAFAAALLAGSVIVYSFWLILATTAFWLVRIENILVIFQSVYEAGRWPVSIYPAWLRFALTFIVPVAFAITVPAQALAGRLTWPLLGGAAAFAAALFIVARMFWRTGVRRYSGASS